MRAVAAIALAATLAASPALAQPASTPPEVAYTDRYGGSIAVVDGVSLAVAALGVWMLGVELAKDNNDNEASNLPDDGTIALGAGLVGAGAVTYLIGGPIVHGKHGNRRGAARSVGVRALLPLVGGLVGGQDDGDTAAYLAIGGVASAMVLDWLVLAKQEVRYTPYVRSWNDSYVVGLGGSF